MSEHTERGVSDHLAVELYERMVRVANLYRGLTPGTAQLLEAHLMRALRDRWFERRGYTIPKEVSNGDQVP